MTTPRRFELTVLPAGRDNYGIELGVYEGNDRWVATKVPPSKVGAIWGDIVSAVVTSGQRRTTVHAGRRKPISLSEEAGVRLTLVSLATAPIKKSKRIASVRAGVDAMTSEEAFYWYAHVTGQKSARALKALRILLAGE